MESAPPPPPPPPPGAPLRPAPDAAVGSSPAAPAPAAPVPTASVPSAPAPAEPAASPPAPAEPGSEAAPAPRRDVEAVPRTTSSDLSDLLGQLADEGGAVDPNAPLTDPRDLERPGDVAAVVVKSTGAINFDPEFASFGSRVGGWMIDTIITTLALLPGLALLFAGSGILRLLAVLLLAVGLGVAAWAYAAAIARRGQWFGNRIMSTTVVNVTNGEFVDRPHAFTRFVVRAVFSPILFAGFLLALTNISRRTFHDQVAGTIVTRPSRATWSVGDEGAESDAA